MSLPFSRSQEWWKVVLVKESAFIQQVLHPKGMLPNINILPRNKSRSYFKDIKLSNDFWQYIALGWRLIRALLFEQHSDENRDKHCAMFSRAASYSIRRRKRLFPAWHSSDFSSAHFSEGKRETVGTFIIWDVPGFNIWDFWQWG